MKPGEVIHAQEDFVVMYVGNNEYLTGEKTVEIPEKYIITKEYLAGTCMCLVTAPSFANTHLDNVDLVIGFAIGIFLLDVEPRRTALEWIKTQQAYGCLYHYDFVEKLLMNTYDLDPILETIIFEDFKAKVIFEMGFMTWRPQ